MPMANQANSMAISSGWIKAINAVAANAVAATAVSATAESTACLCHTLKSASVHVAIMLRRR